MPFVVRWNDAEAPSRRLCSRNDSKELRCGETGGGITPGLTGCRPHPEWRQAKAWTVGGDIWPA